MGPNAFLTLDLTYAKLRKREYTKTLMRPTAAIGRE